MKDSIRRKLVEIRKHYKDWERDSELISRIFLSLPFVEQFNVFMLYYPHKNEVNTLPIIQHFLDRGKTVLLPKVSHKHLLPVKIENLKSVHTGYAGIKEPEGEVFSGKIDLIVVPAVAFDRKGHRLGYGKGFYDRFLKDRKDSLKVGFAFDFQVLDKLPAEPHDVPVDLIITPTQIINTKEEQSDE